MSGERDWFEVVRFSQVMKKVSNSNVMLKADALGPGPHVAPIPLNQIPPAAKIQVPARCPDLSFARCPYSSSSNLISESGRLIILSLISESEANLQNFIRVPDHFDDVYAEKKLAANEEPLLEQTVDVVTQPSNAIVNLDIVTLNQAPHAKVKAPSLPDVSKAEEFVPCITFGVYKRLIFKGKKSGVLKKPMDIYRPDWELTNDFIMDKGPLCHSFIDHLATPGQFACLRSLPHQGVYDREDVAATRLGLKEAGKEETDLSTLNAKFQDLLWEKEQFELRNASLSGQVDGETEVKAKFTRMLSDQQRRFDDRVAVLDSCLDKMAKEMDEEFAPMLRDTKATKDFLAEACASQTSSYLEALLVMEVHEDGENEVGTSTHPASGSSSSVGGVINQSTIASSIPYAGDAGTAARDATPVDQVETVETENVLIETALDDKADETISSTPNASRANPAVLNSTNPILSR
nr:hypothetical protein [Tanacetum cinerariifolium]